jgi:hypothetical protein
MAQESRRPDYEDDQSKMSKVDAHKAMNEKNPVWQEMPSEDAIKERDEIVELLEKYDNATPGVNTSKFRETLKRVGHKPKELTKLKIKLDRVANREWEERANNHDAFRAEGKLGEKLDKEKAQLFSGFKSQDLLKGEYNKFKLLTEMNEMLKPKGEFIFRYKKQSPLVKQLFEQSMGQLDYAGTMEQTSKEGLLKKVLKLVGDLEDSPEAIQKEFMKRSKGIKKVGELNVLKAKLILEYGAMDSKYEDSLKDAKEYFGGETAEEFLNEFRDLKSFARMKFWIQVLPKYISDRKAEHIKIEGLLEQLPAKKANRFRDIVNKLGLSERVAFRKETLEPEFRIGNVMVAEYKGELLAAHHERVPLYTQNEKDTLTRHFLTLNAKQQKQVLSVERLNVARRSGVIRRYKALPPKVREDQAFFEGNSIDRDALLFKAKQKLAEGGTVNAFAALNDDEHLDNEQVRDISSALETDEGQDALDDAFYTEVGERDRKNIDNVINIAKWKTEHAMQAKQKNETQADTFIRDYEKYKVGLSEGDHKKDASAETDWLKASKIRESQVVKDLYGKGFATPVASIPKERQDLTRSDMTNLKGEKLSNAMSLSPYDTFIHLAEDDDREPVDVAAMLGEVVEEIATKMAKEMAEGLANRMNAKGRNRLTLVNSLSSAKNMENMKSHFWASQMGEQGKKLRGSRIKKAA